MSTTFTVEEVTQSFLKDQGGAPLSIPVRQFSARHSPQVKRLIDGASYMGLAIKQSGTGKLEAIAISTPCKVYIVKIDADRTMIPKDLLQGNNLAIPATFEITSVAIQIAHQLGLRVRGADLSRVHSGEPLYPSQVASKSGMLVPGMRKGFGLDALWHGKPRDEREALENLCLRAWISARVAEVHAQALETNKKIDTTSLSDKVLSVLGEHLLEVHLLSTAKPNAIAAEFSAFETTTEGNLRVVNSRYNTRIRRGNQVVIVKNARGEELAGRVRQVHGKSTEIGFSGGRAPPSLESVRVVGRASFTNGEKERDLLLAHCLHGEANLRDSAFFRLIWFADSSEFRTLTVERNGRGLPTSNILGQASQLNPSQRQVVLSMISDEPIIIVHGPPGTGKTSTMAAAAQIWANQRDPAWIVAHSNVAVKNIAEKLFDKNIDFKILVSKDFYVEWHEHIYEAIQERVIRTDELPQRPDKAASNELIGDSIIILSTLGSLSNPTLHNNNLFNMVPVERLVIDEASQINVFDYLSIFHKFRKTLEKVCFFGDPHQLPPFGKDNAPTIRSIFNIEHLLQRKTTSYFLDTQYRMPTPLGDFTSLHVYDGKLRSFHRIKDMSCIAFVDEARGREQKQQFSWTNASEVQTITNIVKNYYLRKDFVVITPYDAQRAAIEKSLKRELLPWEGRVFNVDSFQGNEASFVLVSVVRTDQPGFLRSTHRMNVMLTRCKAGIVIVSHRKFITGAGRGTLLGALAQFCTKKLGNDNYWVNWNDVAGRVASLPGVPVERDQRKPGEQGRARIWSESFETGSASGRIDGSRFPPLPEKCMGKGELGKVSAKWERPSLLSNYPLSQASGDTPRLPLSGSKELRFARDISLSSPLASAGEARVQQGRSRQALRDTSRIFSLAYSAPGTRQTALGSHNGVLHPPPSIAPLDIDEFPSLPVEDVPHSRLLPRGDWGSMPGADVVKRSLKPIVHEKATGKKTKSKGKKEVLFSTHTRAAWL